MKFIYGFKQNEKGEGCRIDNNYKKNEIGAQSPFKLLMYAKQYSHYILTFFSINYETKS